MRSEKFKNCSDDDLKRKLNEELSRLRDFKSFSDVYKEILQEISSRRTALLNVQFGETIPDIKGVIKSQRAILKKQRNKKKYKK